MDYGYVLSIEDNYCIVSNLQDVAIFDVVEFGELTKGVVFSFQDNISCVYCFDNKNIVSGTYVKNTGKSLSIPVSNDLIGSIINGNWQVEVGKDVHNTQLKEVFADIKPIMERKPLNEPLYFGVTKIDTCIPIGKGQRELILGDEKTGKTSLAIDLILNQRGANVKCIYVSIGQKQSEVNRIHSILVERDAMEYTTIIYAPSTEVLQQYLLPYYGITFGEYLQEQGEDVVIIYDDLSNHANVYRNISLMGRSMVGKEAYPANIFNIHGELLERSGKFIRGSITAIPIAQTIGNDISRFIETNLISITDGQIFLDSNLTRNNIFPSIDITLSVSRVGSAVQSKLMKDNVGSLKLKIGQLKELENMTQLGYQQNTNSYYDLLVLKGLTSQNQYTPCNYIEELAIAMIIHHSLINYDNITSEQYLMEECIYKIKKQIKEESKNWNEDDLLEKVKMLINLSQ